jgi:putative ABC transport system permease protein
MIAAPTAWYFTHQWLEAFAYRIELSWLIFLVAGLSGISIAFLIVSVQGIKTASSNPVSSLRSE